VLTIFLHFNAHSQSNQKYTHTLLKSKILNDRVKLTISVPENYTNSKAHYPVVYVLDGKWFFSQGVTSQTHFSRYQMTPDLIIIGVDAKRGWYLNNSKMFNRFLEKELVPTINKTYRTSKERLLFGWEVSGGLVMEVLGNTPELFTGYLAASPGPLDNTFSERFQYRHDALKTLLNSDKKIKTSLFITTGKSDYPSQYGVDNLLDFLTKNNLENFEWTYKNLTEENHSTTAFKTLHNGIESYFKYYAVLRFRTIEAYLLKGGNTYSESYYKKRKVKYNFTEERNNTDYLKSCKNIVFIAMNKQNYKVFDEHMQQFLRKKMLSITHYNHASMFATYYLKNNNPKMAMKLMNYYTNKFPEAARPYTILGNIYKQLNDKRRAKEYYQKAIDLGIKNTDRRLSEYQNNLKQLLK
jgi:predicted alpha/beta superfamily hydrolase